VQLEHKGEAEDDTAPLPGLRPALQGLAIAPGTFDEAPLTEEARGTPRARWSSARQSTSVGIDGCSQLYA